MFTNLISIFYFVKIETISEDIINVISGEFLAPTLRHGFISELVRQNLSLKKIGEFVGHKHIAMTELYTHLNTTDMKEILSKV